MEAPEDRLPAQFEVGEWFADRGLNEVRRGETSVRLEPKVMRLLTRLAEHAGETVSREELLDSVWEGQHVVEGVLTRAASQLRQALGDDAQEPRYLQTVPKKGYRLIAPVRPVIDQAESPPAVAESGRRSLGAIAVMGVLLVAAALLILTARNGDESAEPAVRPSIAVLPFLNLSEDPAQEYFSLGLTESLIAELARFSGLRVVSRTSIMRYRDGAPPASDLARELGVSSFIEGSVMEADGRVRVTVQLVRADSDEHLWAESYERQLTDVLSLQREIARAVAREIEVRLTSSEEERLQAAEPLEEESLRLYLKGRYHWNLRTAADLEASRDYFEDVIERDPTFARAWAGLADALGQLYGYNYLPPKEAFPAAREAAREALRLDPGLAHAHASLGLVAFNLDWDAAEAEASYRRAIELEPSYATAHQWYSELLSLVGRHEEALREIDLAWGLDPFSPVVRAAMGQRLNAAGRFEEALGRLDQALEIQPRLTWAHRERAIALQRLGRTDEALDARRDEARARGLEGEGLLDLERALAEEGAAAFWRWQLERLEALSATRWVPPVLMAEALAGLGESERALDWLDRSVDARGLYLPHTIRSSAFDAIRDEPRFVAVVRAFTRAAGVGG